MNCIFVTGGAGFIGSNFILHWLQHGGLAVVNPDKLRTTKATRLTKSAEPTKPQSRS